MVVGFLSIGMSMLLCRVTYLREHRRQVFSCALSMTSWSELSSRLYRPASKKVLGIASVSVIMLFGSTVWNCCWYVFVMNCTWLWRMLVSSPFRCLFWRISWSCVGIVSGGMAVLHSPMSAYPKSLHASSQLSAGAFVVCCSVSYCIFLLLVSPCCRCRLCDCAVGGGLSCEGLYMVSSLYVCELCDCVVGGRLSCDCLCRFLSRSLNSGPLRCSGHFGLVLCCCH